MRFHQHNCSKSFKNKLRKYRFEGLVVKPVNVVHKIRNYDRIIKNSNNAT